MLIRVRSNMMESEETMEAEEEEESVIISGITVARAQTNFNTNKFYVKFMGTIQNYTNCPLVAHDSNVESGYVQNPPVDILPGTSEAFGGHKESYTPTGCAGTLAWRIGGTDQMLLVLYSVPYDHNIYSNKLGIGILPLDGPSSFKDLYTATETENYSLKSYKSKLSSLVLTTDKFKVKAQMGNSHKTIIEIQLYPLNSEDLAINLKDKK